jgi:hypothetical protein
MSWYYCYQLAIKSSLDNKLYPLGPFNYKKELINVIVNSRSFEPPSLHEDFRNIDPQSLSPALSEAIHYDPAYKNLFSCLPLHKLPKGSPTKSGYFLNEDIDYFTGTKGASLYDDIFSVHLSEGQYVRKLENELKFGVPTSKFDEDEDDLPTYSCADFSYFTYIDYTSAEYFASELRNAADLATGNTASALAQEFGEDYEIYVILSQG